LLGIKIKIKESASEPPHSYAGIAATQEEIKNLTTRIRADPTRQKQEPSTLQQLMALSLENATIVSYLILGRINASKYSNPPRTWAIELLTPWSAISEAHLKGQLDKSLEPGYLIILRSPGDGKGLSVPDPCVDPSREQPILLAIEDKKHHEQHHETEFAIVRKKKYGRSSEGPFERETARRATCEEVTNPHLSQEETENAVNNFLATFSALYDDVPPEERTKVLDSVPLAMGRDVDDSDEDEDNSEYESGYSRSLVDD
jgi:hypothetical protein